MKTFRAEIKITADCDEADELAPAEVWVWLSQQFDGCDLGEVEVGGVTVDLATQPTDAQSLTMTSRGFAVCLFTDDYGYACSLQESSVESSVAGEACVWLGVDSPKILEEGWHQQFPERTRTPPPARIAGLRIRHSRMHLTQQMVAGIIPHLQRFVATGRLT